MFLCPDYFKFIRFVDHNLIVKREKILGEKKEEEKNLLPYFGFFGSEKIRCDVT